MNRKALRIIGGVVTVAVVFLGVILAVVGLGGRKSEGAASVVATGFSGYDLARAVIGDEAEVAMLVKPGAEAHDFEPTPEDIIKIKNAELFVYVGGESEEWVTDLLRDNEIPAEKTLRLMDLVEVKEEELAEGMEGHEHDGGGEHEGHEHESEEGHEGEAYNQHEEVEYDEHIWTSPVNAIKLVNGIKEKLASLHPERRASYEQNAAAYTARLVEIDRQIRDVVASSKNKELIFGDRFPFRYFVYEYGLDYFAAFPGCAEQTEASSRTVAFLVDRARTDGVKVILKIELTSDKLARAIADEVGAEVMTLSAAHNVSAEDFRRGVTYADLMEENVKVLREALK